MDRSAMATSPRRKPPQDVEANLRRALKALTPYIRHRPLCPGMFGNDAACTCGLSELTGRVSRFGTLPTAEVMEP
jgi:hypothetical protein